MAQSAGVGHGIEDIYKSVINDVIAQVKDAFLDESVDIEVLQQLKKAWEDKVQESGTVDLEDQKVVPPPAIRPHPARPSSSGQQQPSQPSANVPTQFLIQQQQQQTPSAGHQVHSTPNNPQSTMMMLRAQQANTGFQSVPSSQPAFLVSQNGQFIAQPAAGNIQIVGGAGGQVQPQYAIMQGNRMVLVPQSQLPINLTNPQLLNALRQQQLQGQQQQQSGSNGHIPQLDGATTINPETTGTSRKKVVTQKQQKPRTVKFIPQLDGGPGMSDSSSDEEDEEDEDPLKRYAGLQNDDAGDGEGNEEEPLNSDDDQSDEEDLRTLFDSDNVVVCQFEKVHRARSKWKFVLKDGIMHLNGKDYCFQKCNGEAEW